MTEVTIPANAEQSADISRGFFTDYRNYVPFDLTNDLRRVVACVEPRNQPRGDERVLTAIQTAGGGR